MLAQDFWWFINNREGAPILTAIYRHFGGTPPNGQGLSTLSSQERGSDRNECEKLRFREQRRKQAQEQRLQRIRRLIAQYEFVCKWDTPKDGWVLWYITILTPYSNSNIMGYPHFRSHSYCKNKHGPKSPDELTMDRTAVRGEAFATHSSCKGWPSW